MTKRECFWDVGERRAETGMTGCQMYMYIHATWVAVSCTNTVRRRGCDLNRGPTAPESSTLTTSLPSYSGIKGKSSHIRLPSVGFRSRSRFLAVRMQVTWVINPAVYRLPLLSARHAVTPATLKRAATNFAAWWTEAQRVWTICLRLLPDSVATAIWTRALLRLSPAR